eukprot:717328_1
MRPWWNGIAFMQSWSQISFVVVWLFIWFHWMRIIGSMAIQIGWIDERCGHTCRPCYCLCFDKGNTRWSIGLFIHIVRVRMRVIVSIELKLFTLVELIAAMHFILYFTITPHLLDFSEKPIEFGSSDNAAPLVPLLSFTEQNHQMSATKNCFTPWDGVNFDHDSQIECDE